jgi:hypothetical protein
VYSAFCCRLRPLQLGSASAFACISPGVITKIGEKLVPVRRSEPFLKRADTDTLDEEMPIQTFDYTFGFKLLFEFTYFILKVVVFDLLLADLVDVIAKPPRDISILRFVDEAK